ncbi:MAG: hypothetical protein V1706_05950 [Pseudomonadota bacterium]
MEEQKNVRFKKSQSQRFFRQLEGTSPFSQKTQIIISKQFHQNHYQTKLLRQPWRTWLLKKVTKITGR